MRLKSDDVQITGIRPELMFAIQVTNDTYNKYNQELVITSINDAFHSETSLHYSGCAFDSRTSYFTNNEKQLVHHEIKDRLGIDYDVVLESDHLHIEFQPRRR